MYTNGDNADYSNSLKKHRGMRLFLNKGDYNFEQVWFYLMLRTTKGVAKDFNKNGDIDIAAIAFFSDYDNAPDE